jgi:hypothetical protein
VAVQDMKTVRAIEEVLQKEYGVESLESVRAVQQWELRNPDHVEISPSDSEAIKKVAVEIKNDISYWD